MEAVTSASTHGDHGLAGHHGPSGRRALALASLGALGVVYGDIGTSPLYAMKECLAGPHGVEPLETNVLGVLSLMFWALMLVVTLKYLVFVLRADNKGEGGILALAALLEGTDPRVTRNRLAIPLLLGLFGAGLLFGDGVITPAISVLGAVEGIAEQSPALAELAVPITIAILVGLFLVQRHGTGRIGDGVRADDAGLVHHDRRDAGAVDRRRAGRVPRAQPALRRRFPRSITACTGSCCSAWCSSSSPAARRCTPTWVTSGSDRSGWRGSRSRSPACC